MRPEREALTRLVSDLAREIPDRDGWGWGTPFARVTLEELKSCLLELLASKEELCRKTEELIATREALEAERQRYLALFQYAPDAQVITNGAGLILQANRACARLLQVHPHYLLEDKSLQMFIVERDRGRVLAGLQRINAELLDEPCRYICMLQPRYEDPVLGILTVVRIPLPHDVKFHWVIREAGNWLEPSGQ